MISGAVRGDEAWIKLKVFGIRGREQQIDAVIDTGYTGSLTLPRALINTLGLHWRSVDRGTLADGSEFIFDVYEGSVLWDGNTRQILVDETDAAPLVGMRLLKGYELNMQVRSRGKVTIKRISRGTDSDGGQ
jgi:clan AA aspartic protease